MLHSDTAAIFSGHVVSKRRHTSLVVHCSVWESSYSGSMHNVCSSLKGEATELCTTGCHVSYRTQQGHCWIKLPFRHHSRIILALLNFMVRLISMFLHLTMCHCTHNDHRPTRNYTKLYKDTSLDVSATKKQLACSAMALTLRLCCHEAATCGHDMLLLPDALSLLLTCQRYNWRSLPPDSSLCVSVPTNFLHEKA